MLTRYMAENTAGMLRVVAELVDGVRRAAA
jgi:hypothetical protein